MTVSALGKLTMALCAISAKDRGQVMNECQCKLEADLLTLCDEHKKELERLKANPPAWAIRARKGEGK
jgi:hypothetical protein